ncbi:hypothetical protein BRM1_10755 [Brevibacterium sp. BRM-1]|nr:hypothetical protein [Brevibacterium sp. BRM-1]WAL39727.1 hypothetical protein BRM1_10755 [Brevibacterium sp. BRM-1]
MGAVELDLSTIVLAGTPLAPAPLGASDRLVLMGQSEEVGGALRAVRALPGAAGVPRPPRDGRRVRAWARAALAEALAGTRIRRSAVRAALVRAGADWGLPRAVLTRARLRDLTPLQRSRLQSALASAAAELGGAGWLVLEAPFGGLAGRERAGARDHLVRTLARRGLGLVMSTADPVDAGVVGGRVTVLEKGQVADSGPFGAQLAAPRSNLAAGLAGVNVFSALARGGWISIGHSQVRARTELDGKLFVTIPTSAVRLAVDEFSAHLTSDAVFEAVVVGIHDRGEGVQLTLSPTDTEAGLTLAADLFDFSAAAAHAAAARAAGAQDAGAGSAEAQAAEPEGSGAPAWGILHPGLGADVAAQLAVTGVGAHLFVEVDTAALRAYPVDRAPTALQ